METWDIFISHASEDKHSVALPLANLLEQKGVKVWIDDHQLLLGDSLLKEIEKAMLSSRYGVVILSHTFLQKYWTNIELEALFTKEEEHGKVILPIWHNITKKELSSYSLILSGRLAISTSEGLSYVVDKILKSIDKLDKKSWIQKELKVSFNEILKSKSYISENEYIFLYESIYTTNNIEFILYHEEISFYIKSMFLKCNFLDFFIKNENLHQNFKNNILENRLSRNIILSEKYLNTNEGKLLYLFFKLIKELNDNKLMSRERELNRLIKNIEFIIQNEIENLPKLFNDILKYMGKL